MDCKWEEGEVVFRVWLMVIFFFFLNIQLKDRKEREKEDPCIAKQIGGFLLVLSWYDLGNGFKNRNHSFWQYKNLQ